MKGLLWGLFGLLAALWSLAAWALHGLAGAGPAAVTTVTRWLGLEPGQTQWIAEGLAAAGWLAQALVILFWLMGLGLLLLFGWMAARTADGVARLGEEVSREMARDAAVRGSGPVVEGEALRRSGEALPQRRDPPGG